MHICSPRRILGERNLEQFANGGVLRPGLLGLEQFHLERIMALQVVLLFGQRIEGLAGLAFDPPGWTTKRSLIGASVGTDQAPGISELTIHTRTLNPSGY